VVTDSTCRKKDLKHLNDLIVFIHVISAILWLGGMFFIALVMVPSLRKLGSRETRTEILSNSARRFRTVSWVAIPILVMTGIMNSINRGVSLHSISSGELFSSTFGKILLIKVSLVIMIIFLSILHDFILGPRLVESIKVSGQTSNRTSNTVRKKELVSWIARLNLFLGILVVFCAVILS